MELTYILAILLILQTTRIIHACSCSSTRTIQKAHASKDIQNIVRARLVVRDIDKGTDRAGNEDTIYYGFLVEATYKGCLPSRFGQKGVVFMRTAGNDGLCGMPNLSVGKTYVLEVRKGFLPPLYLCGFFKGLGALSTGEKKFLESRSICCKGQCAPFKTPIGYSL